MGPTAQIIAVFGIVKCVQLAILHLLPTLFDVSSSLLLEDYSFEKQILCQFSTSSELLDSELSKVCLLLLNNTIDKLVVWDAVYFADLFVKGPQYEHQFVFCPLWWRLIKSFPGIKGAVFYPRLLMATFVANMAHLAATLVLYKLTLAIFKNARIFSPKRMALCLLILYVMTPAAAFMTAPYSEPVAAFLSFSCLYLRQLGLDSSPYVILDARHKEETKSVDAQSNEKSGNETTYTRAPDAFYVGLYILSGAFAAVAYGFRANCLLLGILYVYDLFTVRPFPSPSPLIAGLLLGLSFVITQYSNYASICVGSERGEWCNSKLPLLFTYAQGHYWNNGFLKYWTPNNIPNFIFGAPTIILSLLSVRYFREVYPVARIFPIICVNTIFTVLLLLLWHVQIVTRIHLFLPIVYWFVAGLLTQPNFKHRRWGQVCMGYFVIWSVLQVSLFGAFLPPA